MRTTDLFGSAVGGLWRQKGRTFLTLLGVAVGGCALAFSLSLGIGLRAMIDREFQSKPSFWHVHVRVAHKGSAVPESEIPPDKISVAGEMSDERRQRLRRQKVEEYQNTHPRRPPTPLTHAKVAELAALPDVAEVITTHAGQGVVRLGDKGRDAFVIAGRVRTPDLEKRLVAGRMPDDGEALVSEYALYDLGAQDERAVQAMLGRTVRVGIGGVNTAKHLNLARLLGLNVRDLSPGQEAALDKVTGQLPKRIESFDLTPGERAAVRAMFDERDRKPKEKEGPQPPWMTDTIAEREFRVAGVLKAADPEQGRGSLRSHDHWLLARGDVFLPPATGNAFFDELPWVKEYGFDSATVVVRPGGDLKAVAEAAERMGFEQYSAMEWHEAVKQEVTLIAAGLNLFALVSLFVAAIGITNTLVTAVVERTREIGVLKALGATDRQVMAVFLTEGAVIGLLGGVLGLALAWGLSVPGDGLVRRLVQQQSKEPLVSESVFEFPLWLVAATVAFAAVVTTLAAVYPSRRAARVQPVEALRHE